MKREDHGRAVESGLILEAAEPPYLGLRAGIRAPSFGIEIHSKRVSAMTFALLGSFEIDQ